jgi:hypothetical protein
MCHCGQCRKASGTAFASNIPVRADDFRVIAGEETLKSYESSPGKERLFCGRCGSPVISRAATVPGMVRVRAGLIDPPTGARLGFHFHTASKADWWTIEDDLPQYPGDRPK